MSKLVDMASDDPASQAGAASSGLESRMAAVDCKASKCKVGTGVRASESSREMICLPVTGANGEIVALWHLISREGTQHTHRYDKSLFCDASPQVSRLLSTSRIQHGKPAVFQCAHLKCFFAIYLPVPVLLGMSYFFAFLVLRCNSTSNAHVLAALLPDARAPVLYGLEPSEESFKCAQCSGSRSA